MRVVRGSGLAPVDVSADIVNTVDNDNDGSAVVAWFVVVLP
jgi:hypothetical protein